MTIGKHLPTGEIVITLSPKEAKEFNARKRVSKFVADANGEWRIDVKLTRIKDIDMPIG